MSKTNIEFMENLQSQSGQSHTGKKRMILAVFESINNLGTRKPFMVNNNSFKEKVLQNQYNVVVRIVLYHHLKFAAQRELCAEVFRLGHTLTDILITNKAATSVTTKMSGTKRK